MNEETRELKARLERLARLLEEFKNHKDADQDKQPVDYDAVERSINVWR
jgi:hypothetical protein